MNVGLAEESYWLSCESVYRVVNGGSLVGGARVGTRPQS